MFNIAFASKTEYPNLSFCYQVLKTYPSLLNYFNATGVSITLKVSSRGKKISVLTKKCPNFSMRLPLRTRGKLKVGVSPWLIGENTSQNLKHWLPRIQIPNTSQNPKTRPRVQNTSQNPWTWIDIHLNTFRIKSSELKTVS